MKIDGSRMPMIEERELFPADCLTGRKEKEQTEKLQGNNGKYQDASLEAQRERTKIVRGVHRPDICQGHQKAYLKGCISNAYYKRKN